MTLAPNDVEQSLLLAYREEAELYHRALRAADDLVAAYRVGNFHEQPLQRFLGLLDDVSAVEGGMAATKARWVSSGDKPGPQLRTTLAQVAGRLQELIERVGQAEKTAEDQKNRLAPDLELLARSRQMLRAYGVASAGRSS